MTVPNGSTLTVEPGVIVEVNPGLRIQVEGAATLNADGGPLSPILFTSAALTPVRGSWLAIHGLSGSTLNFDYTTVRYGGGNLTGVGDLPGNVHCQGCTLTATNSRFEQSNTNGLLASGGNVSITSSFANDNDDNGFHVQTGYSSLDGNTLSNNGGYPLFLDGTIRGIASIAGSGNGTDAINVTGTLAAGTHTFPAHFPLAITAGLLTVPNGATLSLGPDNVVKSFGGPQRIVIEGGGSLLTDGTSDDPVVFTSLRDDTAGGDTENNGSATTPARGDWYGIQANSGSTATLDNTHIRYSGGNLFGVGDGPANLTCTGCALTVTNSSFEQAKHHGVLTSGSNISITNSTASDNGVHGMWMQSGFTNLNGNTLSDNGGYPLMLQGTIRGIASIAGSGNGTDAINVSGTLAAGTHTFPAQFPLAITAGLLTVPNGSTLSFGPGNVVKALGGDRRVVIEGGGTLQAVSTIADPVVFTSLHDDTAGGDTQHNGNATTPARADWYGIQANSGSTVNLDDTHVRYSGGNLFGVGDGLANLVCTGCALTVTDSRFEQAKHHGILTSGTTVSITNSTSRANGGHGMWMQTGYSNLNGNTLSDNGGHPLVLEGTIRGISSIAGSGNGTDAVRISGTLAGGTHSFSAHFPLAITTGFLNLPNGSTLNLGPGNVVKSFGGSQRIVVEGGASLIADGTPAEPVVFTSLHDDTAGGDTQHNGAAAVPAKGNWYAIQANSGSTVTLDNTHVRYSGGNLSGVGDGQANLVCNACTITVTSSRFDLAKHRGLMVTGSLASTSITSSTASDNGTNGFELNGSYASVNGNTASNNGGYPMVLGGSIRGMASIAGSGNGTDAINVNGTLAAGTHSFPAHFPLAIVVGLVTVPNGASLNLGPGNVVKAIGGPQRVVIEGGGSLLADGTPDSPVVFTSLHDDTAGGDSQHNGAATVPAAGNWYGIQVNAGANVTLDGFDGRYAGGNLFGVGDGPGVVFCNGCTANIGYAVFRDNRQAGLHLTVNTAVTLGNLTFVGNAVGLRSTGTPPAVHSSLFQLNGTAFVGAINFDHTTVVGGAPPGIFNLSDPPGFKDILARDLRLRPGSAAIDTGRMGLTDADGSRRDRGAIPFGTQVGLAVENVCTGTRLTEVRVQASGEGSANLPLVLEVTGANPRAPTTASTDAAGMYDFSYTPDTLGTDTLRVRADGNVNGVGDGGEPLATGTIEVVASCVPVADAGEDQTGDEGVEVTLDGTGSADPDGDVLEFDWRQTSGPPVTLSDASAGMPTFTPPDEGTYVFTLTVDDGTTTDTDEVTVTAQNVAPTASLSVPTNVQEGGGFFLAATNVEDVAADTLSFSFDCGDGTFTAPTATTQRLCIAGDNGTVTVRIRIADGDGGETTLGDDVTVDNRDPTATFVAPEEVDEFDGFQITLDDSEDFAGDLDELEWFFDCGSGTFDGPFDHTEHDCTAGNDGELTVRGRVVDADGGDSTYSETVTVQNVAPVVTAASDQSAVTGETTVFQVGSFTDPAGAMDAPFEVAIDWGDGTPDTQLEFSQPGSLGTRSHAFATGGMKTVTIDVTDLDGDHGIDSFLVDVNTRPIANAGPDQGVNEGAIVTLDGGGSSDPDGHTVSTFEWTQVAGPTVTLTPSGDSISFQPMVDDVYEFDLRVLDQPGLRSAADRVRVTVANVLPLVTSPGAQATTPGTSTVFALGSFSDPGADNPWTVSVNWGDGSTTPLSASMPGSLGSAAHTYAAAGTFVGTVNVADDDGSSSASFQVVVSASPGPAGVECIVPNVLKKKLKRAKVLLETNHCLLGKVKKKFSTKIKKGRVMKQSQRPGTHLPEGTKINLTVSKGRRPG